MVSEILYKRVISQFESNFPRIKRFDENKSRLLKRPEDLSIPEMSSLVDKQIAFANDSEAFIARVLGIYVRLRFHSKNSLIFQNILKKIYENIPSIIKVLQYEKECLDNKDVKNFLEYYSDEKKLIKDIEDKILPFIDLSKDKKINSSIISYIGKGIAIVCLMILLAGKIVAHNQINPGEYGVPSKVMLAYAQTTDTRNFFLDAPSGVYLGKVYLDTEEEIISFQQKLKELGYGDEQISSFIELFTSEGIIVYNNDARNLETAIPHERMHKLIDNLPDHKKKILESAAKSIYTYYEDKGIITDMEKPGNNGFVAIGIIFNWSEFYAHMYSGNIKPEMEKVLEKSFPLAHRIYVELVNSVNSLE